jgi:1,4-alpha-glucan branching enzyme
MKKAPADPLRPALAALFAGATADPHAILGMHTEKSGIVVRVYDPEAESVLIRTEKKTLPMEKTAPEGLFEVRFPRQKKHFNYQVEKHFPDGSSFVSEDPYHFLPGPGEMDLYLFNEGEHHRLYDLLGAHVRKMGEVSGVEFAVWAPNARRVSVVGDFNCWDGRRHMMRKLGSSGVWELFIPSLCVGDIYKYEVLTSDGRVVKKLDPCAQWTEKRPGNAGRVPSDQPFEWHDQAWMEQRRKRNILERPVSIYEVHLGSWGGPGLPPKKDPKDKDEFHNYRQLAEALAAYVKEMGYTHVELLPVCEHPLDQSWGYQVTGFYAPTARYGSPEDFAFFVDTMHRNGIGVILDWVPAHFPKDEFSLGRFDGTALYEHADPRQGEQLDWGTYIFNFGRNEVRNFLIGSALCWLDKYHADGLRVDAVASMLYLNYSRRDGEWIPNQYGGNENLEAIAFLKHLNELAHQLFPGIMMVAEESTSWPGVSRPVYTGGLGFTFKWDMGWMHDMLDYYSLDPVYRSYHHSQLTFSLYYAFTENFILPLSHDEVVHGKKSLLNRMPGDYEQKFANLRAFFCGMMTHPGKKLLFMGGEFAQWIEWNCNQALDWHLLNYPRHTEMRRLNAELNRLYLSEPCLWEDDFTPNGFQWIEGGDVQQSVVSYLRWNKAHTEAVAVILNLTPVVRDHYTIGVPFPGKWREILNTDDYRFGGTGLLNSAPVKTEKGEYHGMAQHISLRLPWLSGVILKRVAETGS